MKLHTKFYLGISAIFGVLALVVALISLNYVNTNSVDFSLSPVCGILALHGEFHLSQNRTANGDRAMRAIR
jgi:hypothetical protein